MHYMHGGQDSRVFGRLGYSFFTKLFFSLRCLRLIGFPFSLGFYSKDLLLGGAIFQNSNLFSFIFVVSCILTVSYRVRLLFIGFAIFPSFHRSLSFVDDIYYFMPVIMLFLGCLFLGGIFYFVTPIIVISFVDCSLGLFVMMVGCLLGLFFSRNYYLTYILSRISFIFFLRSSFISSFLPKFDFSLDYSWSELAGGGGAFLVLKIFSQNMKFFLRMRFLPILFSLGLLFLIIYVYSLKGVNFEGVEDFLHLKKS